MPNIEVTRPRLDARLFRHLLRALLREASYLPDPAARTYHHSHILRTFRSYRSTYQSPKELVAGESDEANGVAHTKKGKKAKRKSIWQDDITKLRQNVRSKTRRWHLFVKGREELGRLARANLGHDSALMRILRQAYGRIGRRKWHLLQPLLDPVEPATTNDLQQILDKDKTLLHSFATSNRLMALVKAQAKASLPAPLTKLRLDPELNKLTERLKPMALKNKRNAYNKWMNEIRERIMAPLPSEEYERLEDIASGRNMHGVRAMKRRPMCQSAKEPRWIYEPSPVKEETEEEETEESDALELTPEMEEFLAKHRRYVRPPKEEPEPEVVKISAELCPSILKVDDSHTLTRRYLSRCLKQIYEQTPTLQLIDGKWKAKFPDTNNQAWKEYLTRDEAKFSRKRNPKARKVTFSDHWMFSDDTTPLKEVPETGTQVT